MNRRLRHLLTGGLIGAAASVLMRMGRKKGKMVGRRNMLQRMGPSLQSFIGELSKEGLWRKILPLRRRLK